MGITFSFYISTCMFPQHFMSKKKDHYGCYKQKIIQNIPEQIFPVYYSWATQDDT